MRASSASGKPLVEYCFIYALRRVDIRSGRSIRVGEKRPPSHGGQIPWVDKPRFYLQVAVMLLGAYPDNHPGVRALDGWVV